MQPSIRSGYSSCDFSRATSGRVSPSELPDSPCQSPPTLVRKPKAPSKAISAEPRPAPVLTEPALAPTIRADPSRASLKACTSNTADFSGVVPPTNLAHVGEVDSEPEVEEVARVQDYEVEGTPAVISEAESDVTSSEDETKVWYTLFTKLSTPNLKSPFQNSEKC